MDDTSSLIDMRHLKIKSIDGQTYELTVPKDVRNAFEISYDISFDFNFVTILMLIFVNVLDLD